MAASVAPAAAWTRRATSPAGGVLRECTGAMRAQEEAAHDGQYVRFGLCWAFPEPAQARVPLRR